MIRKAVLLGAMALVLPTFDTPITPLPEAEAVHVWGHVGYPGYYAYRYPAFRYRAAYYGDYYPGYYAYRYPAMRYGAAYYGGYYPAYYRRPVVRAYRAPMFTYYSSPVYRSGCCGECW